VAASALIRPAGEGYRWVTPLKLCLLPLALVAAMLWGLASGPDPLPFSTVAGIVLEQLGLSFGHSWPAWQVDIVWQLRLPEVVTAVLVGCALSISGAIFQAVLRNPLADPFVMGTSSGAMFGVALAFWIWAPTMATISTFVWMGFGLPQIFAFAGAIGAVTLVFALSAVGRRAGSVTIILAGFAVSTLAIAGMWFAAYQGGHVAFILGWMMGSLGDSSWSQLTIVAPIILLCSVTSLAFVRDLNALLLGEEHAQHLGLRPARVRIILVVVATIMTALSVSLAGIIGFVGLVIPHIARLLFGANHRTLLPATAFLGATFLVACDVLARTVEGGGGVLPLGILTAMVGAPVFLFLLLRSGDAYGF
jgi:iron complex transport system permease protein